ncbi:hypothetical protein AAVH_08304 [Aphelenchoides avenae]|nr:hypothetical protein AAVH_08304 [Aphelenchus avenae]
MCVPEWLDMRGGLDIVDKIHWMWTGFCVLVGLLLLLLAVAVVRTGITLYKLWRESDKKGQTNENYEMGRMDNPPS